MSSKKKEVDKFFEKAFKFGFNSYEAHKDENGNAESIEAHAWEELPCLIDFLIKIRGEKMANAPVAAIDISIILNSAIVVEGFIYELIKLNVGELIDKSSFASRLHKEFTDKLDRGTWLDLKKCFKTATDLDLNSFTDNENWKSISILFNFRNMLTHSKPIKFEVKEENGIAKMKYLSNYEKVYNFLLEKKLIERTNFYKSLRPDFITSDVSNYFWNEAQQFMINVMEIDKNDDIDHYHEIAFDYKNNA